MSMFGFGSAVYCHTYASIAPRPSIFLVYVQGKQYLMNEGGGKGVGGGGQGYTSPCQYFLYVQKQTHLFRETACSLGISCTH